MSRPLVAFALLVFAAIGLAPIAAMLPRIGMADLTDILDTSDRTLGLLVRTIKYGGCIAGLSLILGLPFGFLVARTDVPGAAWLRPLGIVPLLMPPLLLGMVYVVLSDQPGLETAILVLALSNFPLVALFSARAAERIDARREEAALVSGGLSAVLRMELPLILPAALCGACLAFAFAVNDFSVADYVTFAGAKFNVYADEIFANWKQTKAPGKAVASALPLMALSLAGLLPALALRRRGALRTLGSDFKSPERLRLGCWRWPAFLFCFALVTLGVLLPLGQLLWEASGGPFLLRARANAEPGEVPPALWSGVVGGIRDSFALALEQMRGDLRNSLIFAIGAATLCVPLGLIIGHAIERMRGTLRASMLELVALLPLAAPAVLFGIGFVVLWNHDWSASFYDQGPMAVLLFAGRFLPFTILVLSGAVASLHPNLEEAAALSGAGPAERLTAVVGPSLKGSMAGAWVLVFVFAMRELDAAVLVDAANRTAVFRLYNSVHFGRDAHVAALALLLVFTLLLPGLLWTVFAKKRLEVLP